ncbi:MAG: exodeoxyribonuclease VII large subunit [Planctomycetes bacterium]|nr:exodeoxyribonuclease VII large subunit [Planctomycetota bacterium]
MARLPFNPDNLPDRDAGPPAQREQRRYGSLAGPAPLSVTQLTDLIKRVLADRTPSPVRVVGEVSNFSDRNHWYLSLKDEQNVIACVMWASAARKTDFRPEHGQQVLATGRLDYYGPQGRLQLYIDKLEPIGLGALEQRFRQLCDELRGLGYFADENKQPMPPFPEHIAVVTSAKGAALQDVINTARQRWAGIRLSHVDVLVQGADAAPDIARAIRALGQQHEALKLDAIILTRGGGSLEDLWAFNERLVADAVRDCPIPIAAAIGHETDTTIAELVADLRCSTPTQAAARLVPDAAGECQHLDQLAHRLSLSLRRRAEHARTRLEAAARHAFFRRPVESLDQHRERLAADVRHLTAALRDRLANLRAALSDMQHALARIEPMSRLRVARQQLVAHERHLRATMTQRATTQRHRLDALARQLNAIDPHHVLARGYSYTTTPAGDLLRSPNQVHPGDAIVSHLADGKIHSRVTASDAPRLKSSASDKKPPRRQTGGDDQASLFGD